MSVSGLAVHGAERREHPREAANEPVKVVTGGGHVLPAVVVDRSLRGMRLRIDDVSALSGELTVLHPTRGLAQFARIAWRTAPYAGLSITRSVEMRTATGADTVQLRKLWREHIA
jgi:hypothetical protein